MSEHIRIKKRYERIAEYICMIQYQKSIQTNVQINICDKYIGITKYSNIFITLCHQPHGHQALALARVGEHGAAKISERKQNSAIGVIWK